MPLTALLLTSWHCASTCSGSWEQRAMPGESAGPLCSSDTRQRDSTMCSAPGLTGSPAPATSHSPWTTTVVWSLVHRWRRDAGPGTSPPGEPGTHAVNRPRSPGRLAERPARRCVARRCNRLLRWQDDRPRARSGAADLKAVHAFHPSLRSAQSGDARNIVDFVIVCVGSEDHSSRPRTAKRSAPRCERPTWTGNCTSMVARSTASPTRIPRRRRAPRPVSATIPAMRRVLGPRCSCCWTRPSGEDEAPITATSRSVVSGSRPEARAAHLAPAGRLT